MMKTAVLLVLISCAVCEVVVIPNEAKQTPRCDNSVAMAVGALTERMSQVETKLQDTEKELAELKSITQGTPKVAFSATFTGLRNTGPFKTDTPLKYKIVFSNFGGCYSSTTGIFTAKVKGVYFFRFTMKVTHNPNSIVSLVKNGVRLVSVWDTSKSDVNDMASNAAVLSLEVGDTVYVQLWAHREVYDDNNHYNSFAGFLLFSN